MPSAVPLSTPARATAIDNFRYPSQANGVDPADIGDNGQTTSASLPESCSFALHRVLQAAFDPAQARLERSDLPNPSPAGKTGFHPGVGIKLDGPHIIAARISVAALIAGDHAGRKPAARQHEGHGTGKKCAQNPRLAIKQESSLLCSPSSGRSQGSNGKVSRLKWPQQGPEPGRHRQGTGCAIRQPSAAARIHVSGRPYRDALAAVPIHSPAGYFPG